MGRPEIRNGAEALRTLDGLLNEGKPPAVEFIIACALRGSDALPWWRPRLTRGNPFGHALVCYTLPGTSERIVFNIVNAGEDRDRIANFLRFEEMLFSDGGPCCGSDQGGIYNRSFTGLRIEELPDDDILAMHHAFLSLRHQGAAGRIRFGIAGGQIKGLSRQLLNLGDEVVGNCAVWSAAGLVAAGLLKRPSMFPGRLWAMVHERALRAGRAVHVVHYEEVRGCEKNDPLLASAPGEIASVTGPLLTWRYWRRSRFAHAVVEAPEAGSDRVTVRKVNEPEVPTLPVPGTRFAVLATALAGLAGTGYHVSALALALALAICY